MKKPKISFKGNIAYSEEFDDIYFNTDDPASESEYVFASALDEIWDLQDSFIVGELGFGAGLNFLSLCRKFENSSKKLHFVSIEGYAMSATEIRQIYKKLKIFSRESAHLAKNFPPRINGIHRINYAPNITLDLCFGDADKMINELDFKADVWFMDGFAPSKNETMWSKEIFMQIARLCKPRAIVRTYSCAKIVRDNFSATGFNLELRKGYGKKRQMSHAVFVGENVKLKDGYFARPTPPKNAKTALIIGAGIAGLATAHELSALGLNVVIAEKERKVATNGSGNHCGILLPLLTRPDVALGRMHINAFLLAVRFYKSVFSKRYAKFCGAYEYAFDDELLQRYEQNAVQNSEIFEFQKEAKPYPAVFIKDGACMRPAKSCQKLAKNFNIKFSHEYQSHTHLKNGKISVKFKGLPAVKTDILVFATGSQSSEIFKNLPLSFVRGQVTHIVPLIELDTPKSARGYITPAFDGVQVVGATYARNDAFAMPRASDDSENLQKVSEFLDGQVAQIYMQDERDQDLTPSNLNVLGSRVGWRSYSSDRFPIIGALYDEKFYQSAYNDLFWSKHKGVSELAKYEPNVYLNIAHGSRGLGTAVLGAKILGDLIATRPLCIEKSLFNELHPARFLIRKLKKGIKS